MAKHQDDERLIELTLATVGEGELEEQFQEALARAQELLEDTSRWKGNAKTVAVKITPEVEIERDLETGFYRVTAVGMKVKEPTKRPVVTGAYLRDGAFFVEKPVQQLTILRPEKPQSNEE